MLFSTFPEARQAQVKGWRRFGDSPPGARTVAACSWKRSLGFYYQFNLHQYDQAISEFQKAVQVAPDFAPAYNGLGYALLSSERDKDAEAAFRKYIVLIPNEPNPYDSLAELLMKMGRFDESIQSYRKVISIDPHFFSVYRGIATNLMYQGKHKEAVAELQKEYDLAANDSDRRDALWSMAVCYVDEGKFQEALEMVRRRMMPPMERWTGNGGGLKLGNLRNRGRIWTRRRLSPRI